MPIAVALATGVVLWLFIHGYHNSDHRWAAAAAVFGASAVAIGVIGIPFAIYQLAAVERDLSPRSDLRNAVNQLRIEGSRLATQFPQRGVTAPRELLTASNDWTDKVTQFLHARTDEAEAEDFGRVRGESGWPGDDLDARLNYLRDNLLPKVIARYW